MLMMRYLVKLTHPNNLDCCQSTEIRFYQGATVPSVDFAGFEHRFHHF